VIKFIAHRGFAKEEKQNTVSAFKRASESNAYGVETDVRITKDGVFVVFHDKSAARLSGKYKIIEKTDFEDVQKLKLYDKLKRHRIPTIIDYLQNCKLNKKAAVVEIKSNLTREQTEKLIQIIDNEDYLPKTIFISFNKQVLEIIRAQLPEQPIQLLAIKYKQEDLMYLQVNNFDIDISHRQLTKERISEYHSRGIQVNCWTVNRLKRSMLLQQWGVDFITTDKLILSENQLCSSPT
jgi:glycerophosphoryl diester phosphodiesterase